ncbi:MAG: hypothetical protein KDK89_21365 [Alphaproteobacteria bacterium]|nr:hypothetical protein [Alphaproteobacteria bacterium]
MQHRLINWSARKLLDDHAGTQPAGNWLVPAFLALAWVAATALGASSVTDIDPRRLGDIGLIAIVPANLWIAYGILCCGFVMTLGRGLENSVLPLLFLVTLAFFLHAIPALSYGTLRYSWAWKHIGVVDYILRHGRLGSDEPYLAAYHNWPTLFVLSAGLLRLFNATTASLIEVARFFPFILSLGHIGVLTLLFRRFTRDRRHIWLAIWIFLLGNWIGQDYYSPQGLAFVLYLGVNALCLGPLRLSQQRNSPGLPAFQPLRRLIDWCVTPLPKPHVHRRKLWQPLSALLVLLLILAIVTTHQLTPVALVIALAILAMTGQLSAGYFIFALVASVGWIMFMASPYMALLLPGMVAEFGTTGGVILDRLTDTEKVSTGQAVVVMGDRTLSAVIAAMAALGVFRRLQLGMRDGPAIMLAFVAVPAALLTSYGGEVAFRVYLFALPFMSFLAAASFFPSPGHGRARTFGITLIVACAVLIPGFILANNGKDRQYWFSAGEIAAARWLFETATAPSLLIEGGRNYPTQFLNYENFTYVPLDVEPEESRMAVYRDPAGLLYQWLNNSDYASSFIIITRSQIAFEDDMGKHPHGFLDRIKTSLLQSPRFRVAYINADALIFSLTKTGE